VDLGLAADLCPGLLCGSGYGGLQSRTNRIAKRDMGDDAVSEEGMVAMWALGAIEKLIGKDNVTGAIVFAEAAYCTDRKHVFHAELLEAQDIGLVIDLRRQEAMSNAMTGKEEGFVLSQHTVDIGIRGRAKWCFHRHGVHILQSVDVVQPRAADNAQLHSVGLLICAAVDRIGDAEGGGDGAR